MPTKLNLSSPRAHIVFWVSHDDIVFWVSHDDIVFWVSHDVELSKILDLLSACTKQYFSQQQKNKKGHKLYDLSILTVYIS